jgi:Mn-dependent DtxR family transcriptional regulator
MGMDDVLNVLIKHFGHKLTTVQLGIMLGQNPNTISHYCKKLSERGLIHVDHITRENCGQKINKYWVDEECFGK